MKVTARWIVAIAPPLANRHFFYIHNALYIIAVYTMHATNLSERSSTNLDHKLIRGAPNTKFNYSAGAKAGAE